MNTPNNQDTTSIDELISNLTCATHFLTEEDCIYCDRKKIKALISDQITKARINEANIGLANNESSHHKQLERIAYLNGVKNK